MHAELVEQIAMTALPALPALPQPAPSTSAPRPAGGRFEARPSSPPPPGANGPGSPGQTGFCGSLTGLPLWVGMVSAAAVCA